MVMNPDEEVPVRSSFDLGSVTEDTGFTKDEEEQSTLRRVHAEFDAGMKALDNFHVFDLTESEMKIKQQIKGHKIAYDLVAPLFDSLTQALATIDENYKRRNNQ